MITSGVTSVNGVATMIDGTHNSNFRLTIHNADNTEALFIGNASVTTGNGFRLDAGAVLQMEMNPLEEVYVISSKSGHTVTWLKQV
jgi:hypothetical protein